MSTDIEKPLERRVEELENFMWEVPTLVNNRFGKLEAGQRDTNERLVAIERQLTSLQVDMRDTRGGVTRQLIGQDQSIKDVVQRMDRLETLMASLDQRMGSLETSISKQLADQNAKLDLIVARLPKA